MRLYRLILLAGFTLICSCWNPKPEKSAPTTQPEEEENYTIPPGDENKNGNVDYGERKPPNN